MEHISSIIKRSMAQIKDDMELHQERADLVAERIGSEQDGKSLRHDIKIYERHAEAAQSEAKAIASIEARERIGANIAKRRWEKLRPEDFCI